MKIANYLQDLLYRYECVILPGFGAFLAQKKSASFDETTGTFLPPKKIISFNSQLNKSDGLLANYIAEAENINYQLAVYKIHEFVEKLEASLEKDSRVELANIGTLSLGEEKAVQFEPFENINFLSEAFGLGNFAAAPVKREIYKKQVEEIEEKAPVLFTPERRKARPYLKYAAVGLLALGLSGFAGLTMYSNQVNEHNVAQQQAAESQLQQQIQQATFVIDNPLPSVTFKVERQSGNFHVVAGAFRVEENAQKAVDELRAEGYKARLIGANKFGLHQVVYSSHQTRKEAFSVLKEVKASNQGAWLLVQEL